MIQTLIPLLLLPLTCAQEDQFAAAEARYRECRARIPMKMHARGWTALAQSMDPRAVPILAADYVKPPSLDREQARYLVATIATRYLRDDACVDGLELWRQAHAEPLDAWLWYRTLWIRAEQRGGEELLSLIRETEDVYLRAAAVSALAAARDPAVYEALPLVALAMPAKPAERVVLIGAMAPALLSERRRSHTVEYRRMAVPVIRLLDDEAIPESAKLVLARHLARALGEEQLVIESQPWIELLADRGRGVKSSEVDYARPTFFGIEGSGSRICYVIDASDSMCKQVDGAAKPKGPVSGPKRKREKGELPTADDIPWHRVNTRFDLVREHLKVSLMRLSEEQSFCVVLVGDDAKLLKATRGLTAATRSSVKKAIRELDGIRQGAPTNTRPYGTLRGMTNLHGGLRVAFGVRSRRVVTEGAYANPATYVEGADTIFVLSDGDPTWDDWDAIDQNYHEDTLGDPESRIASGGATRVHYHGPYVKWENLFEDVQRMNLFRKAEIHCVGIGEVSAGSLSRLAALGMGRMVTFAY